MDSIFYIVAKSYSPEGGIYQYAINEEGECRKLSFCPVRQSNWLEFAPNGKRAYATGIYDGAPVITSLTTASDGSLHLEDSVTLEKVSGNSCHLSVYQEAHRLYSANYSDGSVSELILDAQGRLEGICQTIRHTGHGVHSTRQTQAHVHQTVITPDRRYLAVVDLGIDEIIAYPLSAENGIDATAACHCPITPPGSGPRHIVFSCNGQNAYLVTELKNEIISLKYHDGAFSATGRCSTLPKGCTAANTAAAIRLSPDGTSLWVTNRGDDSITCCLLHSNGMLGNCSFFTSGEKGPRDGNFVAAGRYYLAANEAGDSVTVFRHDAAGHRLEFTGRQLKLPAPLQIVPAP